MHLSTLYNYTVSTIIVCRRTTSNVSTTTTPPHVATPAPYVRSAFPLYLLPYNPTSPNLSICTAIRWSDDPPPSYGRYLLSSIGAIGSPASSSHLPAISLSSNQHCCGNIYDRIHSRTLAFALSALVSAVLTAHWLMTEPVTRCCPHVAVSVHTVHCCCLQLSSAQSILSLRSVASTHGQVCPHKDFPQLHSNLSHLSTHQAMGSS